MIRLSIVIVLYNEIKIIGKCLQSIEKNRIPKMEILIIDNGEDKGEIIKKFFPKVRYLKSGGNIGFGQAANIGIKNSKSEYVLILTPDTTLLPETIYQTMIYIKTHPRVGLVTCGLYSSSKKLHPSIYHAFPNLLTTLFEYNFPLHLLIKKLKPDYHPIMYSKKEEKKIISAKHITGAYLLLRREALIDVGLFDKRFKFYREETDLCRRLTKKGWEIHYIPKGGVIHSGKGALHQKITQSNSYYQKSTYEFFKKHNGRAYSFITWVLTFLSSIFSIVYLLLVIIVKSIAEKPTQSRILLKHWISIFVWQMRYGFLTSIK